MQNLSQSGFLDVSPLQFILFSGPLSVFLWLYYFRRLKEEKSKPDLFQENYEDRVADLDRKNDFVVRRIAAYSSAFAIGA